MQRCPVCNGTGRGAFGGPCSGCQGNGQMNDAMALAQVLLVLSIIVAVIVLVWH